MGAECPICGIDLIVEGTTFVGGCKGEEHIHCPNEDYYYSYTYGTTRYIIGDKRFGWHHSDTLEDKKEIRSKIDSAIKTLKKEE